jgi:hypothetical protein
MMLALDDVPLATPVVTLDGVRRGAGLALHVVR